MKWNGNSLPSLRNCKGVFEAPLRKALELVAGVSSGPEVSSCRNLKGYEEGITPTTSKVLLLLSKASSPRGIYCFSHCWSGLKDHLKTKWVVNWSCWTAVISTLKNAAPIELIDINSGSGLVAWLDVLIGLVPVHKKQITSGGSH